MAIAWWIILLIGGGYILADAGALSFIGIESNDVSATELAKVEAKIDGLSEDIEAINRRFADSDAARRIEAIANLEVQIFDKRVEQCMAAGDLKVLLLSQLQSLAARWRQLNNVTTGPEFLNCADLGGSE